MEKIKMEIIHFNWLVIVIILKWFNYSNLYNLIKTINTKYSYYPMIIYLKLIMSNKFLLLEK